MSTGCKAGERCSCGTDQTLRATCALATDGTPIKVFGIAFMAPTQQAAAKAHCFGDCAKISMAGGIDDPRFGPLAVCCEEACPYSNYQTPEPYGRTNSFGQPHDVYLRVLAPLAP